MTYVYAWNTVAGENGEWSSETVSQTHVKLYDVQDKAAPVAVADFVQDGSYRAAYLANDTLYLLTDHTGFYERCGWEFFCMAQGDGEEAPSRMYVHRYHNE